MRITTNCKNTCEESQKKNYTPTWLIFSNNLRHLMFTRGILKAKRQNTEKLMPRFAIMAGSTPAAEGPGNQITGEKETSRSNKRR